MDETAVPMEVVIVGVKTPMFELSKETAVKAAVGAIVTVTITAATTALLNRAQEKIKNRTAKLEAELAEIQEQLKN